MKTFIAIVAGIVIGIVGGIFLQPKIMQGKASEVKDSIRTTKTVHEEGKVPQDTEFTPLASGITRSDAEQLFQNYHDSKNAANSKGCLTVERKGTTKVLEAFFLEERGFLEPIRNLASANNSYWGIAGIPAISYNSEGKPSHTMIWVAVIEKVNNEGEKYREFLLPKNDDPTNTDLIYDYTDICPEFCTEDRARLWSEEWREIKN